MAKMKTAVKVILNCPRYLFDSQPAAARAAEAVAWMRARAAFMTIDRFILAILYARSAASMWFLLA